MRAHFLALGCVGLLSSLCTAAALSKVELLQRRVDQEAPPIFDFKERMGELMTQDRMDEEDFLTCELIFNSYVDNLRDHYFEVFKDCIQNEDRQDKLNERMNWCRNECKVAMSSAIPDSSDLCRSWSFQGPMEELSADMERLVGGRLPILSMHDGKDESKKSQRPGFPFKLPPRLRKYSKWIATQSVLLLINVLQSEWNRRATRNLAAKRWADVPGLPIL